MRKTIALIATAAVATTALAAPAAARSKGAFDPITATYREKTDDYCIRTGWGWATAETDRLVRSGDCRDAAEWRRRGLAFDHVRPRAAGRAAPAVVAAR